MVKTEKSAAVINRKEYATAYSRGVITAGGRHHKKQQGCGICRSTPPLRRVVILVRKP